MNPIAVCSPVSYFADDVHGLCARCTAVIHFRPHTAQRVPAADRYCPRCASIVTRLAGGVEAICVDERSLDELALYQARTGRTQ